MRTSVLSLGAVLLLTLADCTEPGNGAGSGGTSSSAGATNSAGTSSSASAANSAGTSSSASATNSAGTSSSAGATNSGGTSSSAGATGAAGGIATTGGSMATGGASSTGGASGGLPGSAGTSGGAATAPTYQGPCDLLTGGCAEAYSVTRAMTASYKGPLFQLGLAADKNAKTLDIGQTAAHTVDMTTWSAYCGGSASKCVVSKIYAQIHSGSNDLLPAIWNAPWGPNCSAGGYTCAAKFTIESTTNLPILTTVAPQEYALSGDNFATGVTGGSKAIGLMYNGRPVPNTVYCCGVFGITHKYNAEDVFGTDFMVALAYGWRDSNGCCIAVNCGKNNSYCVGAEEEENNDLFDYGSSPVDNALVVTQFDPAANAVITFMNGKQVLSHSPPKAKINAGTAIHLGGGGDLSQPDPVLMREAFITNALMSASNVTALKANSEAFYPTLKFP
jgi:alpha-L-arabinofuranosidase B-like protein